MFITVVQYLHIGTVLLWGLMNCFPHCECFLVITVMAIDLIVMNGFHSWLFFNYCNALIGPQLSHGTVIGRGTVWPIGSHTVVNNDVLKGFHSWLWFMWLHSYIVSGRSQKLDMKHHNPMCLVDTAIADHDTAHPRGVHAAHMTTGITCFLF